MTEPKPIRRGVAQVLDRIERNRKWLARRGVRTDDAEPETEKPELDEDRVARRWAKFVPPRFAGASLEALSDLPAQMFDDIARWCASPTSNLMLMGEVGAGKTFSGFAVCRHLIEANRGVRWWPTVKLLDGLRPDGGLYPADATNVDFLFLDDLGGEKPTDWVAERLYLILNQRWLEQRPTIITTNLELTDLCDAIGARSFDRLRDQAVAVRFTGGSRRGVQ